MAGWRPAIALAIALTQTLGGCSWFSDDEEEEIVAPEGVVRPHVPVAAVSNLEIGRTRTGFAVTAYGTAPTLGYSSPELRPRREGRPAADGFLDYDFVALPPRPELGYETGPAEARGIRADLLIETEDLAGATGIRVHGASGGMQIVF